MEVWECVTLGIDAGLVALFYALYRSNNTRAQQIQDAVQVNIDKDLAARVLSGGENIEYGCVEGSVGAHSHLSSRFTDDIGVISQYRHVEHKSRRENGYWRDIRRTIADTVDKIPFFLSNPDSPGVEVNVTEPLEAHYIMNDLKVTHSEFKATEQSLLGRGVDRLFGDVTKGFQETEELLPMGTCLLGLGRITAERGKIILEPPNNGSLYILTTQTRKELLKSVSRNSKIFKVFFVIFGIFGGGFLISVLYRKIKRFFDSRRDSNMFERLRAQMRNRLGGGARGDNAEVGQGNDNREVGEGGGANEDGDTEGRYCVICLTAQRDVVLLDCGHICVCVNCAQALPLPRKCPVCRAHVVRIVPLYNS